jgi:hypothetical protein
MRLTNPAMTTCRHAPVIELQATQPAKRPSLMHDRFSQVRDPAARRQAIEQMSDAVIFQPR